MNTFPADNYIKRERQRKEKNQKMIEKMRSNLPVYTIDEIREYKLPFDEALLIGLQEKGYFSTVSYLKELFEYQTNLREQAGIGTIVWLRPQLIYSRPELEYLSNGLRSSEDNHKKKHFAQECHDFLSLAVHFAFDGPDWWWLGEQLLMQAIRITKEYTSLGGKYEALSHFAYGKFLIENVKEYSAALQQLEIARELSEGKGWTSKNFFPGETGTLFMQVNLHLFHCLYREAKYLMKIDTTKAISRIVEARKRAAESCYHEGETKVLMLKGTCEMESRDVKSAINSFGRALYLQQKLRSIEGICKVRIQLAKAYLMDNNAEKALGTLLLLKEDAEKFDLPFYMGQAYKNLGEYYLIAGEPEKANSLLNKAMEIFRECQVEAPDIETVRNLEAISAGLDRFHDYVKLIKQSGTKDIEGFRHLMKMVAWKDERKPFWDTEEKVHHQKSLNEILVESIATGAGETGKFVDNKVASRKIEGDPDDPKALIELHDNKNTFKSESEPGLESATEK
nr:uncharacterized protein LOC111517982 [Leptinotarsa decemlineata]